MADWRTGQPRPLSPRRARKRAAEPDFELDYLDIDMSDRRRRIWRSKLKALSRLESCCGMGVPVVGSAD